jgi:tetratricopeptide (TPR) repeat protein
MFKPISGAVSRTALFFLVTALVISMLACGGRKNGSESKPGEKPVPVDSTNINVLDRLIRENPKNAELFVKRARLQANKKNYTSALDDQTIALSLDSLKPWYYIDQAEYFIYLGQPNSAKKALNSCLKQFPGNTDAMLKLAEIHLYLQEYGQAKILLRDVTTLNDDLAQIYFLQAMVALETADTLGAVANFKEAIEKEPDYYAAYIQAGKIYANKNDDLAIQYYQSAIDLEPDSYEARYLLGMYYQDHGMLDEAHREYEILSRIDSTQAVPYYNRGYIEMVYRQNFDQAVDWFTEAIERDPGYAEAWYNRGFSRELAGKLREARDDYQKAIELKPNFPLAVKGLNRIDDGKPLIKK